MNQVHLVGRVAREVKLEKTANGKSYMYLTLAIDGYYDRQKGKTSTDFISSIIWGKEAEKCRNLLKGSLIRMAGRLNHRKYTDKSGVEKFSLDVIGEEITFLAKPRFEFESERRSS